MDFEPRNKYLMQCFRKGREAYEQGLDISTCPYEEHNACMFWQRGWISSEMDNDMYSMASENNYE